MVMMMNHKTRKLTDSKSILLLALATVVSACGEEGNSSEAAPAATTTSTATAQAEAAAPAEQAAKPVQVAQYATEGGLQDIVIGDANAPVEIIEYASLTCSHCATFHATTYPELKKAYLDTGKAKLVFRHFVMNRYDMIATMVARCGGIEKAPAMVSVILENQARWLNEDYLSHLTVMARRADRQGTGGCLYLKRENPAAADRHAAAWGRNLSNQCDAHHHH